MFFAIFAVAVQGETQFPHQLRSNTCRAVLIQNTKYTNTGLDIKWKFYQKAQKRCAEVCCWHVDLKLTCWLKVDILTCILYVDSKLWVDLKLTCWLEVDMLTWSWHVDLKLTFWHVFYMLAIRWHFELKLWCWYVVVGMIQESESTYVQKNCNKKDMIATRYICKLNLFDPQVIWHQTMCLKLWQDKRQF